MSITAKLADRLRTMFDNQPCERSLLAAQTIELMIDQKINELRKELIPLRAAQETRIEEAVAVCSACGVSGSGGLASSGSTVTIRCNKLYCPGGTSANR